MNALNLTFEIIKSISIIIASFVAIYGITSWRRETTWKRKYELAEEVLSLFYECREKIHIIRSPFGHSLEGKTRKRNDNETAAISEILDNAYVFQERYENEKAPFIKLSALKYRFMAIFGKDTNKPFDELRIIMNKIFFAAGQIGQLYKENYGKTLSERQAEKSFAKLQENQAIVWSSFGEKDQIAEDVDKIIVKIEGICLSIYKK